MKEQRLPGVKGKPKAKASRWDRGWRLPLSPSPPCGALWAQGRGGAQGKGMPGPWQPTAGDQGGKMGGSGDRPLAREQ